MFESSRQTPNICRGTRTGRRRHIHDAPRVPVDDAAAPWDHRRHRGGGSYGRGGSRAMRGVSRLLLWLFHAKPYRPIPSHHPSHPTVGSKSPSRIIIATPPQKTMSCRPPPLSSKPTKKYLEQTGLMRREHVGAKLREDADQVEADDLHLRVGLLRVAELHRQRHELRPLLGGDLPPWLLLLLVVLWLWLLGCNGSGGCFSCCCLRVLGRIETGGNRLAFGKHRPPVTMPRYGRIRAGTP